jgi:minimal PKS acyl carrier protein
VSATPFTADDVARLLAQTAGVSADVDRDSVFEDLGVDSLALLGLVQVIESDRGVRLPEDTETATTVGEFLDTVNNSLTEVG